MHFRVLLSVFCVLMYAGIVQASPFAYLANNGDNTVSVLDTATNTVVGDPIPVGQGPYGVAVNPQGSRVYVSNQVDKTISIIDTALLPYTGTSPVIATIQLGNRPGGLAVNAAGTRLFVALNDGAGVDVYSTLTNAKLTSVTVGNNPTGIAAVQASGTYKVLVANLGSDSVSIINADDTAGTYVKSASDVALTVGSDPMGIAVISTGLYAYVANNGNNSVSKIDVAAGTISGAAIAVDAGPTGVAITSDNSMLYVTNSASGRVTSYNLNTSAKTTFSLDGVAGSSPMYGPMGIAVGPSGRIYTANNLSNAVSIMTPAGAVYAGPVAVGSMPTSLGNFMGPLLHPIAITAGYGGSITPAAGSLVSTNAAGTSVLVADTKSLTLDIVPEHNFATSSLKIDGNSQAAPLPSSYTFSNVITDTRTIEAAFSRTHWDLTVTKNLYGGAGTGTVSTSVGGINCGIGDLTCGQTASVPVGTSVTVTAIANSTDGSQFIGWGGGFCSGTSSTCVISSMASDTLVNAHFVKTSTGPIRVGTTYYQTLDAAYAAVADGGTIEMLTLDASSNPFTLTSGFNRPAVGVKLVGGYTEWTVPTLPAGSATTIQGPLTIQFGTVTVGSYNSNGAIIVK